MTWPYTAHQQTDTSAFYAALKRGQIVHVLSAGTKGWLRCRAVAAPDGMMLQPFALVGKWDERDLPYEHPTLGLRVPRDIGLVLTGGTFRPWPGIIYEAAIPGTVGERSRFDPRTAPPLGPNGKKLEA